MREQEGSVDDRLAGMRKELEAQFERERSKLMKERDELQAEVERLVVEGGISQSLAKFQANAELLAPHVKGMVKLDKVDGRYVPRIADEEGGGLPAYRAVRQDEPHGHRRAC